MEYLLKSSAIVAIFYLCYKVFLQRETFFQSNRWFLLTGLIVAFVFPFIVIPVYIEVPVTNFQNLTFEDATVISEPEKSFNILQGVLLLYILGVVFFVSRFIIQLVSLKKLLLNTQKEEHDHFTFLKTKDNVSPFSFFKWIVYNPNQFNNNELDQVLSHEKVHVRQFHSLDIIISQISTIIFWFNPFIWFYKKEVQQNLEFIADYYTQSNVDCKKSYQYLLLKSSIPTHQLGLTNNFYNSLIKKRIVMLHKSKSKQSNQLKYLVIIPLLSLFLMSFSTKNVYIKKEVPIVEQKAESKQNINTNQASNNIKNTESKSSNNVNNSSDKQMVIITKDFTDSDFDKVKEHLEKEGVAVKFKNIKRNDSGEIISIKIDVSSKQSNANYNIGGDEPINPIKISFDREGGNLSIGNSNNYHFGKGAYSIRSKDGNHVIHSSSNGSNDYIFKDEGEDVKVVVESKKDNKIHTIASGKNVIHLDSDSDVEFDNDEDIIIIKKDQDGNIVKEEIINEDEDVFVVGDDNSFKVKSIGNGKNKVVFLNDEDGEPLIIIDGKETTEEEMKELDPDEIEKIEVLKGDSATEKYGKKGENGVILITTK
ncbi:MAG: M56 family metallopeptidase [Flavobacteriaceae bacterium]